MRALAVRLPNWLGDTVMAVPTVRALRDSFPEIRVLLAGLWAALLAGQGLAETLVAYPRAWSGRLAAADAARRFRPDSAVLLPNSIESALSAWYWGAGRRVGFRTGARGALLTQGPALPEPRRHQVDEYLMLAEACGAQVVDRAPRLTPPAADASDRHEVRALLADAGIHRADGRRLVAVHLGAAYGPAKLWPRVRVAEFCRLAADDGMDVVLVGAPDDAATADAVGAESSAASLVGRDRPKLDGALQELPGVAHDALTCDVGDSAAVAALFEDIGRQGRAPQLLVNNAGFAASARVQDTSDALWNETLRVNLSGVFHCTRAALASLLRFPFARVVNVASNAGKVGYPDMAGYNAGKAAVINLTRSLAAEWSRHGVNVNAVCPARVDTPMLADVARWITARDGGDADEPLKKMVPAQLGRHVQPVEVGRVVAFLLSPAAAIIRGQSLNVDGGDTPY